jgi:hypothetical protein
MYHPVYRSSYISCKPTTPCIVWLNLVKPWNSCNIHIRLR